MVRACSWQNASLPKSDWQNDGLPAKTVSREAEGRRRRRRVQIKFTSSWRSGKVRRVDDIDLLVATAFGLDPRVLAEVTVPDAAPPSVRVVDTADREERRWAYRAEVLTGVAEGDDTLAKLGARLGVSRATMRRIVAPLVENGDLVERLTEVRVKRGRPKFVYVLGADVRVAA